MNRLKSWFPIILTAVWAIVVGIVWMFAAVFVGGYLLIRRIVRPSEKWPRDEWLDDDR